MFTKGYLYMTAPHRKVILKGSLPQIGYVIITTTTTIGYN